MMFMGSTPVPGRGEFIAREGGTTMLGDDGFFVRSKEKPVLVDRLNIKER